MSGWREEKVIVATISNIKKINRKYKLRKQIRDWIIRCTNKILGMQNSTLDAELSELLWSQRFVTTIQNSKWFQGG